MFAAEKQDFNRALLIAPVVYRGRAYPCVGLGYIGAYLRQHGVNVRIVDTNFTGNDASTALVEEAPCVVGIACEARNVREALALASEAKRAGHVTVLGGLHVSLTREEILKNQPVDFAIHGEGEQAMLELMHALRDGEDYRAIQGLIYRGDAPESKLSVPDSKMPGIEVNPKGVAPKNLDSLPFPAYDLAGITEIFEYPLVTSRHCPYKCTFCTVGTVSTRGEWHPRTAEDLVQELLHARRTYGIKKFFVADEMFSLKLDRVKEFCRLLIEKKNNMPWGVMEGLRADRVDEELCKLLLKAGCNWVVFGIETVDPEVFAGITKGETLSKVHDAIRLAKRSGLRVGGYFVVGLANSTFERDMAAIKYVRDAGLHRAVFWMANPYYGTPMREWVKQNGRLLREPIGDNIVNSLSTMPLFESKQYPAKLVKKAHAMANLRMGNHTFYDEPFPQTWGEQLRHQLRLLGTIVRYDLRYLPFYLWEREHGWRDKPGTTCGWIPGWGGWKTLRRPAAMRRAEERGEVVRGFLPQMLDRLVKPRDDASDHI